MIVKLIASGALAVASLIMAFSYRRYQWRKLDTIDGFVALIFYIKGQIDCYSRPRSEILNSLPPEIFHACNCPMGAATLEEMVEASRIYLDDEPLRLLSTFCSEFGSTFRQEQLRRCDHYISALGEQRKIVSSLVQSRSRAGSALWICAGLGVIILLW
ncbi:MAG: hypothetical protein E7649_06875 [Ruminococcaceae bacterium]|nr:hypothetical protein [Oscillospiraceae bacterium]